MPHTPCQENITFYYLSKCEHCGLEATSLKFLTVSYGKTEKFFSQYCDGDNEDLVGCETVQCAYEFSSKSIPSE